MTVTFVAAPLVSPGGVFHSITELVARARSEGLDWRALVVARGWSAADAEGVDPAGVRIVTAQHRRLAGLRELSRLIRADEWVRCAQTVITLIPQSDTVYALNRRRLPNARWVAYARGLPWPEHGEATAPARLGKRAVALLSLRAADERWAVSEVLARQIGLPEHAPVIPPGIDVAPPEAAAAAARPFTLGWMGRFEPDKDPMFFVDLVRDAGVHGVMYGSGRLREQVERAAGDRIEVRPWAAREDALASMDVYVGTSAREAFGRIPVEAAAFGVPSILARSYGCAAHLYRSDGAVAQALVLDKSQPQRWADAARALDSDAGLRTRAVGAARSAAAQLSTATAVRRIADLLAGP